ncbi:hypothetical protein [Shimia haliotis]|uniref:Uncharacterized protein n=1 Tax=Shimia haliotis TaxID=1280847 RepID=A0A1I4DDA5_9RHOB|nr:hypothetical protein [Shimia haliotis]SFK91472.1 hypothetical protein SAMN04488036_10396 [Shimia haliotis]
MKFPIPISNFEMPAPQRSPYQIQDVQLPWDQYHPNLVDGEGQSFAEIWPFIYNHPPVPNPMVVRFRGYWNLLKSTGYPQDAEYKIQQIETTSTTTSHTASLDAKLSGAAKGLSGEISGSVTAETTVTVVEEQSSSKSFKVPRGQFFRYVSWQWCVDYAFIFPDQPDKLMYYNQIATSLRNGKNASCTIGVPYWVTCKTDQTHTQNIIYNSETGAVIST